MKESLFLYEGDRPQQVFQLQQRGGADLSSTSAKAAA